MHQKVFKQLVLKWAVYELLCFMAPTSGVQLQLQALSDDTQLEEQLGSLAIALEESSLRDALARGLRWADTESVEEIGF